MNTTSGRVRRTISQIRARVRAIFGELTIGGAEEVHLGHTELVGGRALLLRPERDECLEVGMRIPRALRAVGEHEHVRLAAGAGPFRECGAAAELDVIGVRADRERAPARGGRCSLVCGSSRRIPGGRGVEVGRLVDIEAQQLVADDLDGETGRGRCGFDVAAEGARSVLERDLCARGQ